jgi:uncharacterized protein YyaL (SSP411 family)
VSSTPPADPTPNPIDSPSDTPRGANRLARESSPYLLLHAHNPVDWHPWGEEAIARARAEDKPIFLSVGYSTCYWCHVMERESFSDPAIAAEMNRRFVNVKVDREERPDLDEIYMLATQLLTGQGGWPNSVFLTPRLEPFFAGTYFPPRDAHGRPGFPNVLASLDHAWRERRADVEEQAAELAGAIAHHLEEAPPASGPLPGRELALRALDGLRRRFDASRGGFGEAPKFPTPSNLWLALELAGERPDAAMMAAATLDAMARGGLYDQLAGGFHRYSTDREWRVPHFEKMLYDNGLLLELYAREHARSASPEAARIALETAGFLAREMTAPEGAFWSAIDAETRGREGAYYVWTRPQIDRALGAEDAGFLAPILGFDGEPFFEHDEYVLHLPRPLEVLARERRTTREALLAELAPMRSRLLEARSRRERPATDDKILADWNGTAIAGLAVAARTLARPELAEAAARAAEAVLRHLRAPDGGLLHAWRAGAGRIRAFLSDYAFLVRGLLRLEEATGDGRWLDEAVRLADEQGRRLRSPRGGYYNAEQRDDLLFRAKELFDGALPSANGVAALNALDLARRTGEERFRDDAEATLRAFAPVVTTHPDGARTMAIAFARLAALAPQGDRPIAAETAPGAADAEPATRAPGRGRRAIASAAVEPLGAADAGGHRPFVLRLRIEPGWHLASTLELPAVGGDGAEVFGVVLPPPSEVAEVPGAPSLRGYTGELEVRGRVRVDRPRAALRFDFVACGEDACWPAESIEVPLG